MGTIGIVANSGWNLFNYRINLIRALHEKGWRIILFCPYDEYLDRIPDEIYETYIPLRWLAPRSIAPLRDLLFLKELQRAFRSTNPDLILSFTFKPNIYAKQAAGRIPVLATITGLGTPFIKGGFMRRMALALYKNAYKRSGTLFFHNPHDRQLFIEKEIIAPQRAHVVPGSGIEVGSIIPIEPIETGRTVFLYLGRIMPEKGIVELLEAANALVDKHQNASVILAGRWMSSGKLNKDDFKRMTAHPRVRYLGHLDELESVWAMTDCLVLPSYREGLSRSMLEAMARTIPVIASDVPGCGDLLRQGGGWLVKPGDSEALLRAMEHVMSMDKDERRTVGRKGRDIVEGSYSIGAVADRYQKNAIELTEYENDD